MTYPMRDAENGLKESNEMDREKQVTEMASDINDCITEFVTDTLDVYIDDEATAQKMFDKGYRKQSEVAREIFALIIGALEYTRFASPLEKSRTLDYIYSLKKKYTEESENDR